MKRYVSAAAGAGALAVLFAAVAAAAPEAVRDANTDARPTLASTSVPPPAGGMMGPGGSMDARGMHAQSEREYLAHMVPHHEEAVAAARHLERSARPEMRAFGVEIVRTQSAEIEQMKAWLGQWYADAPDDVVYEPMMRDLSVLSGDALDEAFLTDMIPHHMHAVMASQSLLRQGLVEHEEVGDFAGDVRDVQRREIMQMRQWQRQWS